MSLNFAEACARAAAGDIRPGGIGIQKEKLLHATLKWWVDENPAHHEVTLPGGRVADVFDGHRVTEIQTGSFSPLRPKLAALLERYPVTVVQPLVHRKTLCWITPETGEATAPRKSPRVGSLADAGAQLVYLLPLLGHPNLTVQLLLLDVAERRLADGWGRGGKRGSHRLTQVPQALVASHLLRVPADYAALIPAALPEVFTAAAFGKAAQLQGRRRAGALKVLLERGALLPSGKEGNALLYRRSAPMGEDA